MNIDLPNPSASVKRETLSRGQALLVDGVFVLIALTAIPLALCYHVWCVVDVQAGLVLLGVFFCMALLGAGFLSLLLRSAAFPERLVFPHAARLGARGAVLLVLLGGGLFVVVATLRHRGLLPAPAVSANPYLFWLAVPLSLIPVATGGALFSVFFTFLLRGKVAVEGTPETPAPPSERRGGFLYVSALILATVALLTPVALPWIPAKVVPVEVAKPVDPVLQLPQPEESKIESVAVEPAFFYLPPLGFYAAPSFRWEIVTRKVIAGVEGSLPAMMSPDGHYLAYVPTETPGSLAVFDLDRFEVHSTYDRMERLRELAWSPESDQVFCLTDQERPFTSVVRLSQRKRLPLPLYRSASFSEGQPFWWQDFEVAFFLGSGPRIYLDLAEMRLRPLEDSFRWRQHVEKSLSVTPQVPRLELPESSRGRLAVAPRIVSYEAPDHQRNDWTLSWEPEFCVADKRLPHRSFLLRYEVRQGDRLATSARSTKIVRVRNNEAEVSYLTLKERPAPVLEVTVPEGAAGGGVEEFQETLAAFGVCAFVCAPRINPLTGQVVGPDREKVKALVRLLPWKGTQAKLWIEEQYHAVETGDVVSDLHRWRQGRPGSLTTPFPERWWAVVSYPSDGAADPEAMPGMGPLERMSEADFRTERGTLHFVGLRYPVSTALPPKSDPPVPTIPGADPSASDLPKPVSLPDTPEAKIRAFVREHYRKLSTKDFEGYLDDYAENVVYYGKAETRNGSLRRAVLSLQSARSVSAVPSEPIEVREEVSDGVTTYEASYEVTLTRVDRSGSPTAHRSRVLLTVFLLKNSVRIVNEGGTEILPP